MTWSTLLRFTQTTHCQWLDMGLWDLSSCGIPHWIKPLGEQREIEPTAVMPTGTASLSCFPHYINDRSGVLAAS
jgi:hypothetical protein